MDFNALLATLLVLAWLVPLVSFTVIVTLSTRYHRPGRWAGFFATGAILTSFVLSAIALGMWVTQHPTAVAAHEDTEHADPEHASSEHASSEHGESRHADSGHEDTAHAASAEHDNSAREDTAHARSKAGSEPEETDHGGTAGHGGPSVSAIVGELYPLAEFGSLRISISYYIDALTVTMFAMVTLVASCIHIYSFGYMHEELEEMTDRLAPTADGKPLVRPGRFHRFFQYLSLFCFSMLGLLLAGNIAMVFVFWELVGICSYFLIGFYFERKSASNAANKAFIVNRVGDFGMLIGIMIVLAGFGTFAFGDTTDDQGNVIEQGIFSQVRPHGSEQMVVPDRLVRMAAREEVEAIYRASPDEATAEAVVAVQMENWKTQNYGYWLLVIGGLGIFCGCVGKSAQFPLHVWLPDAMEGPTPVSALIHAATMVAAGVYLVGRFFPVFLPEVLLVIAYTGCITLFIAATIAITATDIKRVLAYSTVSQLGYMMLALGMGGWVAGLFHLLTHAFFKALLFLGSGSVIHACGTNEMPSMGGLRKKMPWTAGTMLVGCLAISGAGIPFLLGASGIGLSGFYSKDSILAQAFSFRVVNPSHGWLFFVAASLGAVITAFYMFRLWYLTFAGAPRDEHVFNHAHESPRAMVAPLVVLAFFAVVAGWKLPLVNLGVVPLLEQARPLGTAEGVAGGELLPELAMPAEHISHTWGIHFWASVVAFSVALAGFLLATAYYLVGWFDPEKARNRFLPVYWLLRNKWWFDELYHAVFVLPVHFFSRLCAGCDRHGIDRFANGLARWTRGIAQFDAFVDRWFVDGLIDRVAGGTYRLGLWLRTLQTGKLRQYVILIVVATVALFVLVNLYWSYAAAGL